jgi:hypothetical protein
MFPTELVVIDPAYDMLGVRNWDLINDIESNLYILCRFGAFVYRRMDVFEKNISAFSLRYGIGLLR